MRSKLLARLFCSVLLIAAGAWVFALAPRIVRTPTFERFGQKMHWPGSHALSRDGCTFHPHHDQWARRIGYVGGSIAALGAISAAVSARRLGAK